MSTQECVFGLLWVVIIAAPLTRMALALNDIANVLRAGTVQVRDVDRAKVYSEHLGSKLQSANAEKAQPTKTPERSANL